MALAAIIEGVGIVGPGLTSWADACAVLSGAKAFVSVPTELSPPTSLPPSERRRASRATKVVLAAGLEAAAVASCDPSTLATVFASSAGDGDNCHELCLQLATGDPQLSPTRFHNSVHNAPAGYWGIASGSMAPSSVICAHDGSFGAGLFEALAYVETTGERCLLVAYDTDYPEPMRTARPTPDAFGIALVLAPVTGSSASPSMAASVSVATTPARRGLVSITVDRTDDATTTMPEAGIEAMRRAIAAARGLPLLAAIARGDAGRVVIDYLGSRQIAIDVTPCQIAIDGTPC